MSKSVLKLLLILYSKLNSRLRIFILVVNDIIALLLSTLIILKIYSSSINIIFNDYLWLIFSYVLVSPILFFLSNNYTSFTRYINSRFLYQIIIKNTFSLFSIYLFGFLYKLSLPNLNFWLLLGITSSSLISFFRVLQRDFLLYLNSHSKFNKSRERDSIAIYGAGMAGALLLNSLSKGLDNKVYTFVDDNKDLYKRTINGISVCSPDKLKELAKKKVINKILIAIPSLTNKRLREIINNVQDLDVKLLKVPSILDITSGRARIDALKPIEIDDLLGRPIVEPAKDLLGPNIINKSICVTGAGGSIGSELCREIVKLQPKLLVMIDNSEIALYTIQNELEKNSLNKHNLVTLLADVCNYELLKNIFIDYSIDIVFHAAAYKHVPLLQSNELVGIANNIRSTRNLASIVHELRLEQMVLISSDKAVRPTNIMGVTKRISELIIKAYSERDKNESNKKFNTKYSMVRFGNVLGSSGSVVPLFKKQIDSGGPITITDKNIIRYFMTIREAAQLVLQSSVLTVGGEVFLLDMGEPVKIYELAKQMIRLSGLQIKSENNPDGDIEIVFTGLRSGEKLYEELLVDGKSENTKHPLIFKEKEINKNFKYNDFFDNLDNLDNAINEFNKEKVFGVISYIVPDWENTF